jgi:hypothetical protein
MSLSATSFEILKVLGDGGNVTFYTTPGFGGYTLWGGDGQKRDLCVCTFHLTDLCDPGLISLRLLYGPRIQGVSNDALGTIYTITERGQSFLRSLR